MSKKKDLTSKRFGYLTALYPDTNKTNKRSKWICRCDCGNITSVATCDLTSGHTQSCGCKKFESRNATHGKSKTPLYSVWCDMKKRCYNQNEYSYPHYGGRGIVVCNEWLNDFAAFELWAVNNGYSESLTIDRINNDKNYCPENCRWVTHDKQQRNRSNNIFVVYAGKKITLSELSRITGISYAVLWYRKSKAVKKHDTFDLSDLLID